MRQERLLLDALQTLGLSWILLLLLLLDGAHVDGAEMLGLVEVLVEGIRRMDGLVFFGGIFALGGVSWVG